MLLLFTLMLTLAAGEPPADDILAGPEVVEDEPASPTLVKRDFDGTVQVLEDDPYFAALQRLDLTGDQAAALARIDAERAGDFDEAVRRNYDLIVELGAGFADAPLRQKISLLNRVRTAFATFSDRGTLLDEMREHLTDEQTTQVEQMVAAYVDARIIGSDEEPPGRIERVQRSTRIRLEDFGRAIRRSIERQIEPRRELLEELLAELKVTPEQDGRIRTVLEPFAVKDFQELTTPADRQEMFADLRAILTPEQRDKLFTILLRRWRGDE